MDNTVSPPAYYTKGGYQTRYIADCGKNAAGLCETQTYSPNVQIIRQSHRTLTLTISVLLRKNGNMVT